MEDDSFSNLIAECQATIRRLVDLSEYDPYAGLLKWGKVALRRQGMSDERIDSLLRDRTVAQQWLTIRWYLNHESYLKLREILKRLE